MKISQAIVSVLMVGSFVHETAFAWNEETHMLLSEFASQDSLLAKDKSNYLQKLGFNNDLDEKFKWNGTELPVKKWITQGAYSEDAGEKLDAVTGRARYNSHFHNPLKPWNNAGLSDLFQNGESSLRWAQDGVKQGLSLGGDWSWQTIRVFFYNALTKAIDSKRQAYFAQTFRGLGHQMHLIQDAAQPAHVRNDAHPADGAGWMEGLETWTKHKILTLDDIKYFASNPVTPQVALNVSNDGYSPISQFIDTKQYKQSLIPGTSLAWGLSEYANSNYVSDDTIFTENFSQTDGHYFPYPRYSTGCYEQYDTTLPDGKKRTYLRKKCDGEPVEHFVAAGPLFKYLSLFPSQQRSALKLDSSTHSDYAQKLLPRAVGYSAGLLNYFFRGKINLIEPYPDIQAGKFVIRNNSDEDMNGTFSVYYDDIKDSRKILGIWENVRIATGTQTDFIATPISFKAPSDTEIKDRYVLVFRGQLGNENDAVAGQVTRAFREEWNSGLNNNHPWLYSDTDLHNNSSYGQITNTITNGKLVKDNVVMNNYYNIGNINETLIVQSWYAPVADPYPGSSSPSYCTEPGPGPRYCLDSACQTCFQSDFGKEFPFPINEETHLSLKIDSMTKSVPVSCPSWPQETAYQGIVLSFAVGPEKWDIKVNFTLSGNEAFYNVNSNIIIPQGQDFTVNIYEMLAPMVQLLQPINLYDVKIIQWIHCGSSDTEYQQHMEVDYVRVMDR